MPDQLVGKLDPGILRNDFDEVLLDFLWIFVLGQIETAREAHDVRIDDDSAGDSVARTENDVAGFACDAGQRQDFVHCLWNFAFKVFDDAFARAHDRFRFIAEEPGRADFLFQFTWIGVGEIFRCFVFLVERFGDFVHANVGALR